MPAVFTPIVISAALALNAAFRLAFPTCVVERTMASITAFELPNICEPIAIAPMLAEHPINFVELVTVIFVPHLITGRSQRFARLVW